MEMELTGRTRTPPPPFAGLIPVEFTNEVDDHGEEAYTRAKMLSRVLRRLDRWEGGKEAVKTKEGKRDGSGGAGGDGSGRVGLVWMGENGRDDDGGGSVDDGGEGDEDQDLDVDMDDVDERGDGELESEGEDDERMVV